MEIRTEKLTELTTPALKALHDYVKENNEYFDKYKEERRNAGVTVEELTAVELRSDRMLNALEEELDRRVWELFIF